MTHNAFYKTLLQDELTKRISNNARYSLRSFARTLKVDPASLSKILSGKMIPSWKMTQNLVTRLNLNPQQENNFFVSVASMHKERNLKRLTPSLRNFSAVSSQKTEELSLESFRVISDWYHYAILELTFTEDFRSEPEWISRQLGISVLQVKMAIERLKKIGLLVESKGRLKKIDRYVTTTDRSITTPALRLRQKQILEKAIESLEIHSVNIRDTSAVCMAIDPEKIPEAKKMIQDFKRQLCDFLESGKRTQVYELSLSLFPTQRKEIDL